MMLKGKDSVFNLQKVDDNEVAVTNEEEYDDEYDDEYEDEYEVVEWASEEEELEYYKKHNRKKLERLEKESINCMNCKRLGYITCQSLFGKEKVKKFCKFKEEVINYPKKAKSCKHYRKSE